MSLYQSFVVFTFRRTALMCKKRNDFISSVLVLGLVLTSVAEAVDPSLVGWWKFDEGSGSMAADSSGNGNHGFITGAVWTKGKTGQALDFDGANDYVRIVVNPALNNLNAITMAAWVYPRADAHWHVLDKGDGDKRIYAEGVSLTLDGRVRYTGTHAYAQSLSNTLVLNVWQHVAMTWSATDNITRLYHNGVEVSYSGQATGSGSVLDDTTQPFVIGARGNLDIVTFFNGIIDDVRIYNRALSQDEIRKLGGRPEATNPAPADGTLHQDTWVNLSWLPGNLAVSHNVYLGENFDDVDAGIGGTFQGNQSVASFVAGLPGFAYPEGLIPGTTYYWRVDEVNDLDPESLWKGNVWRFTLPPWKAYNPYPADGAKFIDPSVTLSWIPGVGAKLHTVYFGSNFDDVNNATGGTCQGVPTYTPGPLELGKVYYWRVDESGGRGSETYKGDVWSFRTIPIIPITDPHLVGWWKFDEGSGTTATDSSGHGNHGAIMGPAWTAGREGQALNFDGVDDYVRIRANPALNNLNALTFGAWIYPRVDAHWHIVDKGAGDKRLYAEGTSLTLDGRVRYSGTHAFGQSLSNTLVLNAWQHVALTWSTSDNTMRVYHDGVEVNYTTRTNGTGTVNDDTNPPYTIGVRGDIGGPWMGDYFDGMIDDVRIYDYAMSQAEIPKTMRGDLLRARNPSPADGSTPDIKEATPLIWLPGEKAAQHDVYFGKDKVAVDIADASDTTGIYRGRQTVATYTPPEGVEWDGGPYYWRIDEFNTDGTITTGGIWSFTVADFLLVDDFESCTDDDANNEAIWQHWIDGFTVPGNGSQVGELLPPYAEQTIVHGGRQSMPLYYNNTAGVTNSETVLTLIAPRDWTSHDVAELSLWFRGESANTAEPLYVAISNAGGAPAVVADADPAGATIDVWTEWRIPLQAFADQGINLRNVDKIAIGLGGQSGMASAGGSGKMYIDDIRLYRQ